jgi:hypothetical protein
MHVDQPLCVNARVVPWLRRLVTGLSQQRPEFVPSSVHLGFAVDDVVQAQVFLQVLRFPCQYHSTVALHTHISTWGRTIGLIVAAVQRHEQHEHALIPKTVLNTFPSPFSCKNLSTNLVTKCEGLNN